MLKRINERTFIRLALLILLAACSYIDVPACQCQEKLSVVESFAGSEHVVRGKILFSNAYADQKKRQKQIVDDLYATVRIDRNYKGTIRRDEEITLTMRGSRSCYYIFTEDEIGKHVILYLSGPNAAMKVTIPGDDGDPKEAWVLDACSRGGVVDLWSEDFVVLNNPKKYFGRTRIYGNLEIWSRKEPHPNVGGLEIVISGQSGVTKLTTDDHGRFEIFDLPKGLYWISVQPPDGWKASTGAVVTSSGVTGLEAEYSDAGVIRLLISLQEKGHTGLRIGLVQRSQEFLAYEKYEYQTIIAKCFPCWNTDSYRPNRFGEAVPMQSGTKFSGCIQRLSRGGNGKALFDRSIFQRSRRR